MKIKLIQIGKTDKKEIDSLVQDYTKRINRYMPFENVFLPDVKRGKKINEQQQKAEEAQLFFKQIEASDYLVLLDEKGKNMHSVQFSQFIEQKAISSVKTLCFVIGGPYGFDDTMYQRANFKISLSPMTFSHQLIRLIFAEQLYRAQTIIKGEPYHHQ